MLFFNNVLFLYYLRHPLLTKSQMPIPFRLSQSCSFGGWQGVSIYIYIYAYSCIWWLHSICAQQFTFVCQVEYIYIVLRSLHSIPCFFLAKAIPIDGYEMGGMRWKRSPESSQSPPTRILPRPWRSIGVDPPGSSLFWVTLTLNHRGLSIFKRIQNNDSQLYDHMYMRLYPHFVCFIIHWLVHLNIGYWIIMKLM